MRCFIPVNFKTNPPLESKTYLTDSGELYYNANTGHFSISQDLTASCNLLVRKWYKEEELYTEEQLDNERENGYIQGKHDCINEYEHNNIFS